MPRQKDMAGTRKQILEAAIVAFSQKGYRAATIANICRIAGTNIASVNYHFGDKETLYVEAWRESFRRSLEKHPPDGGVAEDAPAEQRLRGWILALLGRITDPTCFDFEIVHMEMANPTGLLSTAIREKVAPMEERLAGILRMLLGEKASEDDIRLCSMSIRSQCLNPMIFGRRPKATHGRNLLPMPPSLDLDPDVIADHVMRFCLEGLPGVRRYIECRKSPKVKRRSAAH